MYNLGFGDELPDGTISDTTSSDNGDSDKVLMTVAASALQFVRAHPGAVIAFRDSTDSRTRKYTMQISKHWGVLKGLVVVEGLTGKGWESFQKNTRYIRLVISRRIS